MSESVLDHIGLAGRQRHAAEVHRLVSEIVGEEPPAPEGRFRRKRDGLLLLRCHQELAERAERAERAFFLRLGGEA